MKQFVRSVFILVLIAGGTLAGVFLLRSRGEPAVPLTLLSIEGVAKPVKVELADTPALREKGLSGHAPLARDEGMLFLFDTPGRPEFWMKDMGFSLDIIWLASDWTIVDITENVAPETYPAVFSPASDAQYVLEVRAGFSKENGVEIGQTATLKK